MEVSPTVNLRLNMLQKKSSGGKEKTELVVEGVLWSSRESTLEMIGQDEWKIGTDFRTWIAIVYSQS